ncbi:MAG TPA: HEAT repeat domain-containing protein [Planctomycetota bacterium]|nr:HEAT repeat domain-containing protein [Planctomycetota bacterium]
MKSVSLSFVLALLLAVGCSSVETATPDSVQDKLTKLEVQMSQKFDKAHAIFDELSDKCLRLERDLRRMESDNQTLRIDVKKLTERLDAVGAAGPRGVPTPGIDRAEVSMKIDQALAKLKTTGNVDEAAKELVPLSRYSVPKMVDALRQVAATEYVTSVEKVLAKCPVDELSGPLDETLKDRLRRTSVARVVGATKDKGLSKILEPYASDPEPGTQIEVGQALLNCRNRMGVPPLLKALTASESEIRFRAVLTLKRVNRGEAYGFDMNKSAEENDAAIKAWYDWWQKEGQKLFE